MSGYVLSEVGKVLENWIDSNGHMNVTAYMALFDRGTEHLLNKCNIGSGHGDLTVVAARIMIDHRRELLLGDEWQLWSGVVAASLDRVTITHRLRSKRSLHSVCDIRGTPFSIQNRSATRFEKDQLSKLNEFVVRGLVDRFESAVSFNNGSHIHVPS